MYGFVTFARFFTFSAAVAQRNVSLRWNGTATTRINVKGVEKDKEVVITPIEMQQLPQNKKKIAFCRCWLSSRFPYCDGTHIAHNKATGDNVGPLVLVAKTSGNV